MVPRKNGARQVIKASIAVLAPIALTMTLSILMAMADNCSANAFETMHTIWPAMPADQLKALPIIKQGSQINQIRGEHIGWPKRWIRPTSNQLRHAGTMAIPLSGKSPIAAAWRWRPTPRNPG